MLTKNTQVFVQDTTAVSKCPPMQFNGKSVCKHLHALNYHQPGMTCSCKERIILRLSENHCATAHPDTGSRGPAVVKLSMDINATVGLETNGFHEAQAGTQLFLEERRRIQRETGIDTGFTVTYTPHSGQKMIGALPNQSTQKVDHAHGDHVMYNKRELKWAPNSSVILGQRSQDRVRQGDVTHPLLKHTGLRIGKTPETQCGYEDIQHCNGYITESRCIVEKAKNRDYCFGHSKLMTKRENRSKEVVVGEVVALEHFKDLSGSDDESPNEGSFEEGSGEESFEEGEKKVSLQLLL